MTQRREPSLFVPGIKPRGVQTLEDIIFSQERARSSLPLINITALATGTAPQRIALDVHRTRIRLIRARIFNSTSAGQHLVEIYFSDLTTPQASILAAQSNGDTVVDILRVPDLGEDATRTYAAGQGPDGATTHPLYARFPVSPGGSNHLAIVEYTVEK